MAKKKINEEREMNIEIPSVRIGVRHILIFICLAAILTSALLAYIFRSTIFDFMVSTAEQILAWTGLGIVLAIIWIGAIALFVVKGLAIYTLRNFHSHILALILVSASIWSCLTLFTPDYGFPGWSHASAEVSFGGKAAQFLTANSSTLAVACSVLLFISATVLIRPRLIYKSYVYTKSIGLFVYLICFYIFNAVASMYQGSKKDPELQSSNSVIEEVPVEVMTPHIRESTIMNGLQDMEIENTFEDSKIIESPNKSWVENAEKLGYFLPNEVSDTNVTSTDNSEVDDEAQIFVIKEKLDTEKDGIKFNSHWYVEYKESDRKEKDDAKGNNSKDKIAPKKSTKWTLPNKEILSDEESIGISREQIKETSEIIKTTFAEYKVEVEVEKVRPGPTVTMYGIEPGWIRKLKRVRVKDEDGQPKLDKNKKPIVTQVEEKTRISVDTILRREKDLSLALKTPSLRIETPVMGESLLGIEVPNPEPSIVSLRRVMSSPSFKSLNKKSALPVALGRGSDGKEVVFDLTKMPHLLIAGATGSGKSVCLNALISCLIMDRTPSELQMLLIDPKRVELTLYNGIPHLITPVVVETDKVVNLLKGLIREMMDRYRMMEEIGVRNIDSYNSKVTTKMPYIVVAIDELADLMMTAAFDIEQSICRLAQLGRATGIHLIIATQRPSVDVITGLIKANFPSRISFAVTSQIDSRTIMDTVGAEKLLGRGDMLYQPIDGTRPTRVQNVFISDDEINALVDHWKETPWAHKQEIDLHTVGDEETEPGAVNTPANGSNDELINRALQLANKHNKLSTSLLQRRLRIGYPRAARLMDELEDMGIVTTGDGSKSRDVIANSNI